jgi:serine protease
MNNFDKKRLALACTLVFLAGYASAAGRIGNLRAIENDAPHNGYIVKFRPGAPEQASEQALTNMLSATTDKLAKGRLVDTSARSNPLRAFGIEHVRRMSQGASVLRATRALSRREAVSLMQQIASHPDVEYVEPNLIFQHTAVPNDPLYADQWGFGSGPAGIRADKAWDLATGAGVTVAVLDTGTISHPDLAPNVIAGYDFVTPLEQANDGNGRDTNAADPGDACKGTPSSWHGSHVAGTIAAVTNNATGGSGTAFGAKIMPVRVLGVCSGDTADIVDAITWSSGGTVTGVPTLAPNAAAKVINMSLGAGGHVDCPLSYQEAIAGAIARGTTLVVSAGNRNVDARTATPANCANVITVAAVDINGAKATFSNHGPRIDIAAPGVGILSTVDIGLTGPVSPSYGYKNGTSMAAPHVAGVVALMQSRRLAAGLSLYTPAQVKQMLKATANPLSGPCAEGCGAGIVDAEDSVEMSLSNGTLVDKHNDASGKITVAVFEKTSTASGQLTDFAVEVPAEYVVIGGGVQSTDAPEGRLLTASYPNANRSAWLLSTKHLTTSTSPVAAWSIGLKVEGLTRAQLLSHMTYRVSTGPYAQQTSATATMASGYTQIGGGFQVTSAGSGNLAWASYPTLLGGMTGWTAASKDHTSVSAGTIRSHSIGLRTNIPGIGLVSSSVNVSAESAYVAHPAASVLLSTGHALTGCGAKVNWSGAGNLLWKIKPISSATQIGCEAGSKDQQFPSPATIQSYAVGIKLN